MLHQKVDNETPDSLVADDNNHGGKGPYSRVAQWKRAGPITQRSVDRNHAMLDILFFSIRMKY